VTLRFAFAGESLLLDPCGVLFWPARRLLCVADLHLEKGSHFAMSGRFLPPYDTRETLARLAPAIRRHRPERLVFLGDSFHDAAGASRLHETDVAALGAMLDGIAVIWVLGNHDPVAPAALPGEAVQEWREGPLVFRHIGGGEGHEVSGHFHPRAAAATRAGTVRRPCFVADACRIVLPAFGAYTGGLDVDDPAIAALFPRGAKLFLLGDGRLHAFPHRGGGAPARPAAQGSLFG
jgi:DNA ligase-associated metallophosphoesterase